MKQAKLALAMTGFGSVGQSVAQILRDRPDLPLILTAVCDRGGRAIAPTGLDPAALLRAKARGGSVAHHDAGGPGSLDREALGRAQADILIEASSTSFVDGEPGWSYVRDALALRLDVVLASKGALVRHWDELFTLARENACRVGFSSTHGAPFPGVGIVHVGLAGTRLTRIRAMLNSTTGLVLESIESGLSWQDALTQARANGVVETDPTLDLEGFDAAAKCVILARAIFQAPINLEDVQRTGITALEAPEIQVAARQRQSIKLVSTIELSGQTVRARVAPERLPASDPLAGLRDGALGAVYEAQPLGWLLAAGHGPGGLATAAAVIRDILTLGDHQLSPTQSLYKIPDEQENLASCLTSRPYAPATSATTAPAGPSATSDPTPSGVRMDRILGYNSAPTRV